MTWILRLCDCRDLRQADRVEYNVQVQLRFCLVDSSCRQPDCFPAAVFVKVNNMPAPLPVCHRYWIQRVDEGLVEWTQGSQQSWNSWNCKVVLKSQSFSTSVMILAIVVHAQWQFNVLLASCSIAYLFTSCVDPVLTFVLLWDCDNHGSLCNLVVVVAPFGCLWLICGT